MFKHRRSTEDFSEEIKAHLELEADELRREGLSEDEARRKARVEFGNVPAAQERFYLKSRIEWLDNLGRDLEVCDSPADEESGLRRDRDPRACSGHRRECCDLRFCGCRIDQAPAV